MLYKIIGNLKLASVTLPRHPFEVMTHRLETTDLVHCHEKHHKDTHCSIVECMWPFLSYADGQQELDETGLQDAAIFRLRRLSSSFERRALSDASMPLRRAALQAVRSSVSSSQVLGSGIKSAKIFVSQLRSAYRSSVFC
jgi:hypothetical protein